MKIRSLFLLSALFVGACCMTSCEEGTGDNPDELASIYWNKSAAFQMQLKGKVKTVITEDSSDIYSFNQSGNLTSGVHGQEEISFFYSNGRLTKQITTWNWGEESSSDTTSFTYGTSGKYLPIYEDVQSGLFRNIASFKSNHRTTNYVQRGDSMLMISSHGGQYAVANKVQELADTSSLTFNGGLFPVTLRNSYMVCNMTYASDGRFLTMAEAYNYGMDGAYSTLTTYKSDSEYLLPLSKVGKHNGQTYSTETYTYNENEDLTSYVGQDYQYEYSDYVYDAKGNWISRKYRSKYNYGGSDWSEKVTKTRSITYWE